MARTKRAIAAAKKELALEHLLPWWRFGIPFKFIHDTASTLISEMRSVDVVCYIKTWTVSSQSYSLWTRIFYTQTGRWCYFTPRKPMRGPFESFDYLLRFMFEVDNELPDGFIVQIDEWKRELDTQINPRIFR